MVNKIPTIKSSGLFRFAFFSSFVSSADSLTCRRRVGRVEVWVDDVVPMVSFSNCSSCCTANSSRVSSTLSPLYAWSGVQPFSFARWNKEPIPLPPALEKDNQRRWHSPSLYLLDRDWETARTI